jgi:hypothetical protein
MTPMNRSLLTLAGLVKWQKRLAVKEPLQPR